MALRNVQQAYFHSSTFKRQTAFGTPLANADVDAAFPDNTRTFITINKNREEIIDCTGQELADLLIVSQIGGMSLGYDVTPQILGGMFALAYGVAAAPTGTNPYTHNITRLPATSFQPPATTFYLGNRGGSRPALILKDAVVNTVTVSGSSPGRITATSDISFNAAIADSSGYSAPNCTTPTPLRMADIQLLIGGVDYTSILRDFEYTFSNNLLTGDHSFTSGSVNITRLERDNRRTERLSLGLLGNEGDALYVDGNTDTHRAVSLRIGSATNGVTISIPDAILTLDTQGIRYEGEGNESHIRLIVNPIKLSGNANSPTNIVAVNSQSGAYLVAA